MAMSALALCNQDCKATNITKANNTKTKLRMVYLIPWTRQFRPGKTMGPVILKALDNINRRKLLSYYDIEPELERYKV